MHDQIAQAFQIYGMAARVRNELLAQVRDEDLAFRLPGNPSLGELLAEYASVQQSYIDSFSTHRHDLSAVTTDGALASSTKHLA